MKWWRTFSPSINENVINYIIKWRLLIKFFPFIPIYDTLHFFNHIIPHMIYQVKWRLVRICKTKHTIYRGCKLKNVIIQIPPYFIKNCSPFEEGFGLTYSRQVLHSSLSTNLSRARKSCFRNCKNLQRCNSIEHYRYHIVIKNKIRNH